MKSDPIKETIVHLFGRSRRTHQIGLLVVLLAATAAVAHGMEKRAAPDPIVARLPQARPRIEVAFVLDTTGSMSGLLEGAKRKIWSIVNQMADGTPRPEIRVGLVGYRDRGDVYVTRRFDLTSDIDSIYGHLVTLQAGGGGDTPESVNQALHEATRDLSWSDSQNVYKVIFLVGDAPPHTDYQGDVSFQQSLAIARDRGIAVNTIQCGEMATTTTVWKQIAQLGLGEYAAISQNGGMLALDTPMDSQLAELNRALGETALAYGSDADQREMHDKLEAAASAPIDATSARL
jgi:Mg-chelatase subunit ChlD